LLHGWNLPERRSVGQNQKGDKVLEREPELRFNTRLVPFFTMRRTETGVAMTINPPGPKQFPLHQMLWKDFSDAGVIGPTISYAALLTFYFHPKDYYLLLGPQLC
jgi:hypothetical protein